MKLIFLVTALAGVVALTACGPSFTERVYDQDMCELRANALCRQDPNCPGSGTPEWSAMVRQCLEDEGYSAEEIEE